MIEGEEGAGGRLPRTDLADAQAALTEALQRDPSLLEARLRLGRVLLLRGKPHDALPELERIARESSNPAQIYMAKMSEGRCRAQNAFGEAMQPQVDRDPWLDYLKGQPDRVDSLAGELRSLIP